MSSGGGSPPYRATPGTRTLCSYRDRRATAFMVRSLVAGSGYPAYCVCVCDVHVHMYYVHVHMYMYMYICICTCIRVPKK
jgi:hypothetical protein